MANVRSAAGSGAAVKSHVVTVDAHNTGKLSPHSSPYLLTVLVRIPTL